MAKLTTLITEMGEGAPVDTMSAKDIYNFYFLWWTANNNPQLVATPFGKEVMMHYLTQLKTKYVRLFTRLLAKQIAKYAGRGRVDSDFPTGSVPQLPSMSPKELQTLMAKTFRSDMQRRNDKWDLVADFTTKLANSSSAKDMFLYINQLNNAVHNTQGRVLDKLPNYWNEILKAFNVVDKATSPHLQLKGMVDKDIRDLWNQHEDEGPPTDTYNERLMMHEGLEKILHVRESHEEANTKSLAYKSGVKMALKDKLEGNNRKIDQLPSDFQAGYNSVRKTSMWDKLNGRLTQLAAMFGNSYGNRR
jgi:hypothetical protein